MLDRRRFLTRALATAAAPAALWARPAAGMASLTDVWERTMDGANRHVAGITPPELAANEEYWAEIQRAFAIDRTMVNLNNGGVCPSPRVVQEALRRYLEFSNEAPAYTMWKILEPAIESVRERLAGSFGVDPEEIAVTRNASEALEIVQLGLDLEPGDEVLTTNQDYGRMLTTWDQRARRDGIVVKKISFPLPPPSLDDLVRRFEEAIGPRTRVLHFCHITNLTGQIFPVGDLVALARRRGLEAIVDGAHAYAHFPFTHADLGCDFYGTSLHKWLLAPIGTGFLHVRRERIPDVWPLMAATEEQSGDIRKFEEIGTHPAANHNAIAEALTFHEAIGAERKAARLRFLRDRWMERVDGMPGVRLYTSRDPAMGCAISTVGLDGVETPALAEHLWKAHRIFVTSILHDEFDGIRVTPNVYTTLEEIDRFAAALEKVAEQGLPEA
ncbi:MAG TPA: aminotransferase class V-fold PLP-dependent enzyme [Longimicrobiales bacterium]|nr:aminotransferase class V-fold PLP-dependent enzyme [Longimicrobiales bacterium]